MGKLAMDSASKKEKKKNPKNPHHCHHPKKKKNLGRPSKSDLSRRYPSRTLSESDPPRRSLRPLRRRHRPEEVEEPYFFDFDDEEEEEEERKKREKKLTVVLKLNRGSKKPYPAESGGAHSPDPTSSLEEDSENGNKPFKKRRINGPDDADGDDDDGDDDVGGDDDDDDGDVRSNKSEDRKVERSNAIPKSGESVSGTPDDSPLSTPLPDQKTLEFILHKLQKKDIYGVYAEPVDPEELPDYHDVIKHPMDFSTIRKKLASGAYSSLEQLESDVILICSNAMQYNSPETIYHKQARAIQELARKRFEKLRVAARNEMELKSAQKTRLNVAKKSVKKSICRSTHEPVGSDFSSGATLANAGDTCTGPNTTQAIGFDKAGSVDGLVVDGNSFLDENKHDKVEEISAKGFQSKLWRKPFVVDENRRSTYNSPCPLLPRTESVFATFDSEMKQLVAVGLSADHSYARSLARFAATLGPVAWKIASRKIEQALPAGYKFGHGWVGEYEPLQTPVLLLENHSQWQNAFNANSENHMERSKGEEIKMLKGTQDADSKIAQWGSRSPMNVPPEFVASNTPKPTNSVNKLGWFGVVGTKPISNDACSQHHQQQSSHNTDIAEHGNDSLKQAEPSCLASISSTIPINAASQRPEYEPLQTPLWLLENRSQWQKAFNANPENHMERSKGEEIKMLKGTQDGDSKIAQWSSRSPMNVPPELVASNTPKPSNSENKLGWFGVVGTKSTSNDAYSQHHQQQSSHNTDIAEHGHDSLKQAEPSCLASVSSTIPINAASQRPEYEPLQTPVRLLENHSQWQKAFNANSENHMERSKGEEIKMLKGTQDGESKIAQWSSRSPMNAPPELVASNTPKPSNSENKLGWFGFVGTKPTSNDACLQHHQQQSSHNMDIAEHGHDSLKQAEPSCLASVSSTIPINVASQRPEYGSKVTSSRLLEMVSKNKNLMHSMPLGQPESPALCVNEHASQLANGGMMMDDGVVGTLPNGRRTSNADSTNTVGFVLNHQAAGAAAGAMSFFSHGNHDQGLSDPVKLMMMLSGKMTNQSKSVNASMVDNSQVTSPVLLSRRDDSSAAAAAAKAWMSFAATGTKPTEKNLAQMQIAAASLYNPTRELPGSVSQFHGDTAGAGGPQMFNRFTTQALPRPIHNEDLQFQSSRSVTFSQSVPADLSRFPIQSPWRGLVPHNPQQRQKTDMLPPDLNIGFQPPASPARQPPSGIQVDSQQPDLALQL